MTASLHKAREAADSSNSTIEVQFPDGVEAEMVIDTPQTELRASGFGVLSLKIPDACPWRVRPDGVPAPYRVRSIADGQYIERLVGFRTVEWRATENLLTGAEDWACVVNGTPFFLAWRELGTNQT